MVNSAVTREGLIETGCEMRPEPDGMGLMMDTPLTEGMMMDAPLTAGIALAPVAGVEASWGGLLPGSALAPVAGVAAPCCCLLPETWSSPGC